MGLFNFIKNAGKKLGIGGSDEPDASEIKKELESHKLGTDKVDVELDGDKVVLKGVVEDQSIFERWSWPSETRLASRRSRPPSSRSWCPIPGFRSRRPT